MADANPNQHEPSDVCYSMHCRFHNVDEPITRDTYRVCGECGHAFQEEIWLVVETNRFHVAMERAIPGSRLPRYVRGAEITSCPFCTHDF